MLEDGDPDTHGVSLYDTIELGNVEAIVDVFLKSCNILNTSILNPVVQLVVEPSVILKHLESSLTSQELRNEDVNIVGVHKGGVLLVVRLGNISCSELVLVQFILIVTFIMRE